MNQGFGFKNKKKKAGVYRTLAALLCCAVAAAGVMSGCSPNTEETEKSVSSSQSITDNKGQAENTAEKDSGAIENSGAEEKPEESSGESSSVSETEENKTETAGNGSSNSSSSDKRETEAPASTESSQQETKPSAQPSTEPATDVPEETAPAAEEDVCVINISCATVLNNMDKLKEEKKDIIPPGGIILSGFQLEIQEGDTAFEVLKRACQENKIHMDTDFTPAYGSAYIKGIANIYERDCGSLSGWTYCVNGKFPSVGCSSYEVKKGDVVEFLYTCDMGADVGNTYP